MTNAHRPKARKEKESTELRSQVTSLDGEKMPESCRSILVIEDDHDTRVSIRNALETEGYFVFSEASGVRGLELLKRIKPPGVIFLDLMMPLMSGQDFLKAKKADPEIAEIPVVIMSAAEDASSIAWGAEGFLKKPINLDLLLETVRDFCGKPR